MRQLYDADLYNNPRTRDTSFYDLDPNLKKRMEWASQIRWDTLMRNGTHSSGFGQLDTFMNILSIADTVGHTDDLRGRWRLGLFFNKYNNHEDPANNTNAGHFDPNQFPFPDMHEKMSRLVGYLSGEPDHPADISYNHTFNSAKGDAYNGMMTMEHLRRVRVLHIIDRNANSFELPELMDDYRRMLAKPGVCCRHDGND
jgi:hypothetical protein